MGSLTLRNIDETLKARLRLSAAENRVSMEEEARKILRLYLLEKRASTGIGTRVSRRFAAIGGGADDAQYQRLFRHRRVEAD